MDDDNADAKTVDDVCIQKHKINEQCPNCVVLANREFYNFIDRWSEQTGESWQRELTKYVLYIPWPDIFEQPANLLEVVDGHVGDAVQDGPRQRQAGVVSAVHLVQSVITLPTETSPWLLRTLTAPLTHLPDIVTNQPCCCSFRLMHAYGACIGCATY